MKYELQNLENLMEAVISPNHLSSISSTVLDQRQLKWLQDIQSEKERICQELNTVVFGTTDSKLIERYIQQHQWSINALADQLLAYKNTAKSERLTAFYSDVGASLESLLSYILKHFDKYFDVNQPLPYSYSIMAREELRNHLEQTEAHLVRSEVNKELLTIALVPIHNFVSRQSRITYRTLSYYKEIMYQLSLLHERKQVSYMVYNYQLISSFIDEVGKMENEITIKLNILLLYMNFNSPDFIAFCIDKLQKKYTGLTDSERLRIMKIYNKFLRQIRIKPGYSLLPELDTASEQIRFWLDQEIDFLKTSTAEYNEYPVNTALHPGTHNIFSETLQIKRLKWKGPKVGLVELGYAFKEAGALDESLREIFECFEVFFSVKLDNTPRIFQEIIARKKEDAIYLAKLAAMVKSRGEKMIENYRPRK